MPHPICRIDAIYQVRGHEVPLGAHWQMGETLLALVKKAAALGKDEFCGSCTCRYSQEAPVVTT